MKPIISKPVIIPASATARVAAFRKKAIRIVDAYEDQLHELYAVRNPILRRDPAQLAVQAKKFADRKKSSGSWIYFPWSRELVRVLSRNEFYELRTARNRNLITADEQQVIRATVIGVAGLSVGSSVLAALALEGFEQFRLADADILSLSNLNRIRAGIQHLGLHKVEIAAQQVYELHPYAKLQTFPSGITASSIQKFVSGLTILVDEMDDLHMKIELRRVARALHIPVISAADNGDGTIVDIERFDLEPRRPLFHGTVPELTGEEIKELGFAERIDLINKMVGFEMVADRMKASVGEVGKTLYSWPQLGGAAMTSGGAVAYVVTHLLRGEDMKSGKYDVKFERAFM